MQPRDFIQKFCAVADVRIHLMRPARDDGRLYASNGHILIVTEDDAEVSAIEASPLVDAAQRLMEQANCRDNWTLLDLTLPAVTPCKACNGTGKSTVCEHCDGTSFANTAEKQKCPKCDGRGEWPDENGSVCWHCDGHGDDYQPIPFGNTFLQRKYLALLRSLQGPVTLSTGPVATDVAFFRFNGGYGALMPCRG